MAQVQTAYFELLQGNLVPFSALTLSEQEQVFKLVNAELLSAATQKALLNRLRQGGYTRLTLRGWHSLKEQPFGELLKANSSLRHLVIERCSQLGNALPQYLA